MQSIMNDKGERFYWKVHRNNFDSFLIYISSRYNFINDIKLFKDYYDDEDYLYLYIRINSYRTVWLSFSKLDDGRIGESDDDWTKENPWIYHGEYHGRKEKLEKLFSIAEL